ncbi:hypothetical protein OOT46_30230 [Aquabacterium sp. A7-Y]|uniref:hypothetical protein n=1 Tax=Aquabacterium sp. A7-Y TaxID=1349605 RepID=UPI00223D41CF|nr:hypothetical protein [Aquabacterium sp. A7-Y]MCW7542076.1 hypothetical protein [Aquabacterium sp. A7-Y]
MNLLDADSWKFTERNASAVQTSRPEFAYDPQGQLLRRCQLWGAAPPAPPLTP